MANFIDSIGKAPKWALISGAAVLLGLMGYGVYWAAIGMKKPKEEVPDKIILDMPDADEDSYSSTALQEFGRSRHQKNDVADYWDSLGNDEDEKTADVEDLSITDDLDPNVYSEYERLQIKNGIKSKEQIDREHAEAKQRADELEHLYATTGGSGYTAAKNKPLTQEQQDSLYLARLETAYRLAAKYSAPAPPPEPEPKPEPEKTEDEEEQERKLDFSTPAPESSSLPMDSFSEDGIITSLDSPASSGGIVHYAGKIRVKPVKATFLKNEKLISGNRVILRLMQDMTLSDGTVIPANTHITGTCQIGRRMKININVLHYGGRMFPVDISVYDNDGTEGIYCPLVEETNATKRKAKKVADAVVSSASTVAGTLVTGNPLLGSMASNSIRSATSSVGSDGTVSVTVSAGYEFYVYENVNEDN